MRKATALALATLALPSVLSPSLIRAQVTPAQPQQQRANRVGRMQRDNCAAGTSDTSRTFRRGVGTDTAGRGVAPPTGPTPISGGTQRSQQYPEYDVVLDIPNLCVERVFLKVDSVTARIALNAQVSNLLRVNAGADVLIGNVDLTIQGVRAQALLLVDLDDVVRAVDQTLTFVDNHPEVVNQLTSTVANVGGAVGGLVGGLINGLLLGTTRDAAGQTIQRLIDQATGSIIERTLSSAGQAIGQRTLGNIMSLPTVSSARNAAGQMVNRVRDQTGAIIEFVQDAAGKLSQIRIVQSGTTR